METKTVDYFVAYFDGACEPVNPGGNIGIGAFVLNPARERIFTLSEYYTADKFDTTTTNNIAEYMAIIEVYKFFIESGLKDEKIIICGDSKMVIEQMNGNYKCNGGAYEPYYNKALFLMERFTDLQHKWIPREQNETADILSKNAMIKNGCTIHKYRK